MTAKNALELEEIISHYEHEAEHKKWCKSVSERHILIGQIRKPELESGFGGRLIISSGGTARSARGFAGILGPNCLTLTRPPPFFPMIADLFRLRS